MRRLTAPRWSDRSFHPCSAACKRISGFHGVARIPHSRDHGVMVASLTGDVKTAFAKLGVETARQWLNLPPGERERTGVIAPTRALRDEINATIHAGLVAEGVIDGPARGGSVRAPEPGAAGDAVRQAGHARLSRDDRGRAFAPAGSRRQPAEEQAADQHPGRGQGPFRAPKPAPTNAARNRSRLSCG